MNLFAGSEAKPARLRRKKRFKVFISYAMVQPDLGKAEELTETLKANGYDVFCATMAMRELESYVITIPIEIYKSDLFIYLISDSSTRTPKFKSGLLDGSYCLTELEMVKAKWENPTNRVLPVLLDEELDINLIPKYITKTINLFHIKGSLTTEVLMQVNKIYEYWRPPNVWVQRILPLMALFLAGVSLGAAALFVWSQATASQKPSADSAGYAEKVRELERNLEEKTSKLESAVEVSTQAQRAKDDLQARANQQEQQLKAKSDELESVRALLTQQQADGAVSRAALTDLQAKLAALGSEMAGLKTSIQDKEAEIKRIRDVSNGHSPASDNPAPEPEGITTGMFYLSTSAVTPVSNNVFMVTSLFYSPYRLTADNQEEILSGLKLKIGDHLKAVTKPVRGDRGYVLIQKE